MTWWQSLLLLFGLLTFLLLVGLPAGFAFLAINLVGAVVYLGGEAGLMQVVRNGVASVTNFSLTPIPFFILMGEVLFHTGLAMKAIDSFDRAISRVPGRLSVVAIVGPALVPGELWIGGEGVTDGYLHRPELNAERFVTDPVQPGQRWYRTGDLVRRLPGGTLDFLGRIDHQVKLRGHRIELGEIESVLLRQDGVKQAVVVARNDAAGEKFLAAYVTARPGVALQPTRLREAVAQALPEIMVPKVVLALPVLPMTPNGKVDRKALPDPRLSAQPRTGSPSELKAGVAPGAAAPESAIEKSIAAIWREVLGLEDVGSTENFFDLGGHSLLVVQVQRRLREATGHEVPITDMFRLPTIRALALHLAGGAPAGATALSEGQSRAQARRLLRNRNAQAAPTA